MTLTVFTNVVLGVCYVLLNLQIHPVLLAVLTVQCILIDTDAVVNILLFVTDLYPGWRKFSTSGNLLLQYQNLLRLR